MYPGGVYYVVLRSRKEFLNSFEEFKVKFKKSKPNSG
jgi:hypothetical protein